MRIPPRLVRRLAIMAPLLVVLLLAGHWRPSRQVRLHQAHFLRAVEDRQWKRAGAFLAGDYHDQWGQDRSAVLARLPQVFGDFAALGVLAEDSRLRWRGGEAMAEARLRIVGTGGPVAQVVMRGAAELTAPFTFEWRRQSWRPWDWGLAGVRQPQLTVPPSFEGES